MKQQRSGRGAKLSLVANITTGSGKKNSAPRHKYALRDRKRCVKIITQSKNANYVEGEKTMDELELRKEAFINLRKSTGMNRMQFCKYFQIPYRTVTDWERGARHMPDYVLRLLEYYVRMEKLGIVDTKKED